MLTHSRKNGDHLKQDASVGRARNPHARENADHLERERCVLRIASSPLKGKLVRKST